MARFTNAEASWDLRVKPVPLHLGRPLTAPEEGGVLELIQVAVDRVESDGGDFEQRGSQLSRGFAGARRMG